MSFLRLGPLCVRFGCLYSLSELYVMLAQQPAQRISRIRLCCSHLPLPATVPSPPRRSCWRAPWCSCHGCLIPSRRPSGPSWTTHISEKGRCVRSHLVDEDQGASIERLSHPHPPSGSLPLVPFQRPHTPFFLEKPILFSSLLKVTSLRLLLAKLMRKRRLSLMVTEGLERMSSSKSFLVVSSAMGGLPPPFLGVRGSPWEASFV